MGEDANREPTAGGLLRRMSGATFHYGLAAVLPKVVGFLLIPVYTLFLSPEQFGVVDLSVTMGLFVAITMRFGMPGAVARFYFEYKDEAGLSDYVTTATWFVVLNSLIVAGLAGVAAHFWLERWIDGFPFIPYVVLTLFTALFAGVPEIQIRLLQAREQSVYAAKLNLARAMTLIGLNILFVVVLRMGALGMLIALLLTALAFLIQSLVYLWPHLRGHFDGRALRSSLAYGSGLAPGHILGAAIPFGVRAILANTTTLAEVGILSIAMRFVSPLTVVNGAMARAFGPVYFSVRTHDSPEGRKSLMRASHAVVILGVIVAASVGLLAPPVIRLILPLRFHAAAGLMPILSIGFLFVLFPTVFNQELNFQKRTKTTSFFTLINALFALPLAWWLAPRYGPVGAAYALVLGSGAKLVVNMVVFRSLSTLTVDWRGMVAGFALCVAVVAGGALTPIESSWWRLLYGFGLSAALVVALWLWGDTAVRSAFQHGMSWLRRERRE